MEKLQTLNRNTRRRVHRSFTKPGKKAGNYFGKTLKEFRLQQNLTQGKAAKLLGISQAQWSGYEKGTSKPTLDTIISIAEKFKVEPLALLGKTIDKFKFPNDPGKELSIIEYGKIVEDVVETYRNSRLQFKIAGR